MGRPSQWECLAADFRRYLELRPGYPRHSFLRRAGIAVAEETFWVIFWYRFGRWAKTELTIPVVRHACLLVYMVAFRLLRMLLGISISAECEAGPGLYFGHFGGVWINPQARLGRSVSILNGVTIGLGGQGAVEGVPEIGDFVYIGPHATLVGRLRVGNGCVIGANSLVVADVPDGATAIGVPARVLMKGANPISAKARAAGGGEATGAGDTLGGAAAVREPEPRAGA